VAYFKLQPRHSPGATEKNNEDLSQESQCPEIRIGQNQNTSQEALSRVSNTLASRVENSDRRQAILTGVTWFPSRFVPANSEIVLQIRSRPLPLHPFQIVIHYSSNRWTIYSVELLAATLNSSTTTIVSCQLKLANHRNSINFNFPHGVRLSPTGTAATVWPIVPAPAYR
jgi:hypothetical protein